MRFPRTVLLVVLLASTARAATWSQSWTPAPNEKDIRATVCPLKYDKKWAYAIELDDGATDTGVFAPGFFADFHFTDAPPGEPKGKQMPIVGSLALFLYRIGANPTYLSFDDIKDIRSKGWAVANHSYAHKGRTYGTPPEILTPEQIDEDLFWSQAILARELGRAPTHFVYPNGYTPYSEELAKFGLVSGSLVGGKGGSNLGKMGDDFLFITRNYLDEGAWTNQYSKGEPMAGFPPNGPVEGDLIIDFTHGISTDPNSPNQKRWKDRMTALTTQYGAGGTDEFWNASVEDVISYWRAAKVAEVGLTPGKLSVSVPDTLPGTPLTIRLEGVPAGATIPAPPDGGIYRKGGTVWITTPTIGTPGAAAPKPLVKRIFKGPAEPTIVLDAPARVAAVRVRQHGNPLPENELKVDVTSPDGTVHSLGTQPQPATFISGIHLFASVPNHEAPLAASVEIPTSPSIKEVEIWVLDDGNAPATK